MRITHPNIPVSHQSPSKLDLNPRTENNTPSTLDKPRPIAQKKPKSIRQAKRATRKAKRKSIEHRAKKNADSYTAFVVLSAVSTIVFLGGSGAAIYTGLRYGKAEGTQQGLRLISNASNDFFTESGKLTKDAQKNSQHVPGLYGMLKNIEKSADKENETIQSTIEKTQNEAVAESKRFRGLTVGTSVAAGAGLLGMIIFISAAKITRHRGNMLYRRDRKTRRLSLHSNIGLQQAGASLKFRW